MHIGPVNSPSTASNPKRLHRLDRWLYSGGHPNGLARVMNRISAIYFGSGRLANSHWVTLGVPGRRTGRTVSLPVVVADYQGERYLVSMLGRKANWVLNVRAAEGRVVLRHGRRAAVGLEEVEVDARAPILRRYPDCAPGARAHIPVDPQAPLGEFARIAHGYPVFRIKESSR